jgi:hypothetical protein
MSDDGCIRNLQLENKENNTEVENKKIGLTLESGLPITENTTIRDFRLEMGGANINGKIFFIY